MKINYITLLHELTTFLFFLSTRPFLRRAYGRIPFRRQEFKFGPKLFLF